MRSILKIFLLFSGLLFVRGAPLDPEKQQQINEILEAVLECRTILGIQIAVVQDEEVIFFNGYGLMDMESERPVTTDALYGIASVTKQFMSTLLGMVLEENGLSWNTKVRDVLGEDFYFYDGLRTSQVKMRDLAGHRVGLPSRNGVGAKADFNRRDHVFDLRFIRPTGDFRDSTIYNNNAYDLMAYIAELLTGQTVEDLMTERIFKPANMTSTTFFQTVDLSRDDLAQPYANVYFGEPLRKVNNSINAILLRTGGSGNIVTNAEDMVQWMKLQLNGGRIGEVQIIPENIIKDTHTEVNLWPGLPDIFNQPNLPVGLVSSGYALGFENRWYRGYKLLAHGGWITGYNTLLSLAPDMKLGIFMTLNGVDSFDLARNPVHAFIFDIVLDFDPWLNTTTICTFPEPWIPLPPLDQLQHEIQTDEQDYHYVKRPTSAVPVYPSDLSPYVGRYGEFFYGNITVFIDQSDGKLYLLYGVLEPWELIPVQEENHFLGYAAQSVWPLHIDSVMFKMSDEGLEQFDIVTLTQDFSDPMDFVRDLKRTDAPDPPNPNDCS